MIDFVLSKKSLKELIWHYGKYHRDKLFKAQHLNSTVLNSIGKRRTNLYHENAKGLSNFNAITKASHFLVWCFFT